MKTHTNAQICWIYPLISGHLMLKYNLILIYDEKCQVVAPLTWFSTNVEKESVLWSRRSDAELEFLISSCFLYSLTATTKPKNVFIVRIHTSDKFVLLSFLLFFFFFFFLHMALTLIRLSFYLSNIKGQIHSFSNLSRRAARCGKKKNYNCNMIIFAKRKCPLRSGEEKYLARASLQRYRTLVWCRLSHILLICYRKNVTFWWINGPTLIFLLL